MLGLALSLSLGNPLFSITAADQQDDLLWADSTIITWEDGTTIDW